MIDTPIHSTENGNVICYNVRITQEYFQPKIGKKFSLNLHKIQ